MKSRAHPSPFDALSFPDSKRYLFTAELTERVFQPSDGETLVESHNLWATFCTITEHL